MRKSFLLFVLLSLQLIFVKTVYADGREIYDRKCAGCHGIEGDGQGPGSSIVYPHPRDFRTWIFKYKSTPEDYPPTDEDFLRMVKKGIPGTAMPGFEKILSDDEIKSIIKYMKHFSVFETEEEEVPVVKIDEIPELGSGVVDKGENFYKELGCPKCHGEKGRGDGTRSQELEDDWENKIIPRNLTKSWTYRRGSSVQDIFTTLKIGIPGTPMPSFAEVQEEMKEEKGTEGKSKETKNAPWYLAHYVHSLHEEQNFGSTLRVKYIDKLPNNPEDETWNLVKPVRFQLIGQVIFPPRNFMPSVEDILVKAVHNGEEIAILVEWDD
ncbi:MAG: c-type cytochrome, partial [Thermodesulfobacteriota bacterium]